MKIFIIPTGLHIDIIFLHWILPTTITDILRFLLCVQFKCTCFFLCTCILCLRMFVQILPVSGVWPLDRSEIIKLLTTVMPLFNPCTVFFHSVFIYRSYACTRAYIEVYSYAASLLRVRSCLSYFMFAMCKPLTLVYYPIYIFLLLRFCIYDMQSYYYSLLFMFEHTVFFCTCMYSFLRSCKRHVALGSMTINK